MVSFCRDLLGCCCSFRRLAFHSMRISLIVSFFVAAKATTHEIIACYNPLPSRYLCCIGCATLLCTRECLPLPFASRSLCPCHFSYCRCHVYVCLCLCFCVFCCWLVSLSSFRQSFIRTTRTVTILVQTSFFVAIDVAICVPCVRSMESHCLNIN